MAHAATMTADPASRQYEYRLAIGGPYHGEYMRIPVDWETLPTFSSGTYRRTAAPPGAPPNAGDLLVHESVAPEQVAALYQDALSRIEHRRPRSTA